MWWEPVLIAVVPSMVTLLVTNWFSRRRYNAEVSKIKTEEKSAESENMKVILETYKVTLEQYKREIEDVNKRFTSYIECANKMAEVNKGKIEFLEKNNLEKDKRILELEKKLDILVAEACFTKGCSKRTYFKDRQV